LLALTGAYLSLVHHEFFALFEDAERATEALRDLAGRPELKGRYSVIVHEDRIQGQATDPELAPEERGTRPVARFGLTWGALQGAAVMALARGVFGLVGGGPLFALLMAGAGAGALIGSFIGALCGHAYEEPHLAHLASHLREGGVLVSVDVQGLPTEREVEALLKQHGAETTHRAVI
jgi:hypothetical protein